MRFALPSSLGEDSWLLWEWVGVCHSWKGPCPQGPGTSLPGQGVTSPTLHLPQAARVAGPGAWCGGVQGGHGACRVPSGDPPTTAGQWVLRLPSSDGPAPGSHGLIR